MKRLVVDPTACAGRGLCAELLPELIELDRWGFPLLREPNVPRELEALADRAVAACPKAALRLQASAQPKLPRRPPVS